MCDGGKDRSPVEPFANAQSVEAFVNKTTRPASVQLRDKKVVQGPLFSQLADSYGDVFRAIPPGGVTERPLKHHINTVLGEAPKCRKKLHRRASTRA